MLNRLNTVASEALDARRAIATELRERLREVPASAALLHRLGDMLTLRAIGAAEHAARVHIDGPTKSELCAVHGGEQLERAVRDWAVPPRAAATAAGWRRLREFPSAAGEAATVYLARLFAIGRIAPQFCAPGVLEHAMEEAGLDLRVADEIRDDAELSALLRTLEASAR
jgi:hypothetical protein